MSLFCRVLLYKEIYAHMKYLEYPTAILPGSYMWWKQWVHLYRIAQFLSKNTHTLTHTKHTHLLSLQNWAAWVCALWICFQMDWNQSTLDTLGCSAVKRAKTYPVLKMLWVWLQLLAFVIQLATSLFSPSFLHFSSSRFPSFCPPFFLSSSFFFFFFLSVFPFPTYTLTFNLSYTIFTFWPPLVPLKSSFISVSLS